MSNMSCLLLAACLAIIAGTIGCRTTVPLGGMLFAMIAAAVVSLAVGPYTLGKTLVLLLQIYVGFSAGIGITRQQLGTVKRVLPVCAILIPLYFIFDIFWGMVIFRLCEMDLFTAMFSLVPGGATDMGSIASEMGADASVVGIMQVVRVLFCCLAYPPIFEMIMQHKSAKKTEVTAVTPARKQIKWTHIMLAAVLAILGGTALKRLQIPGGAIVGAMIMTVAVSYVFDGIAVPKESKTGLQIFGGLYLGSLITTATVMSISSLLIPTLIQIVNMVFFEIISVKLVTKFCSIDLQTALPACATGGLTEMLALTDELGGDKLMVSTIHSLRLLVVVAVFPHIVSLVKLWI